MNSILSYTLILILAAGCIVGCASKKIIKPMERYKEILEEQDISKLRLPIRFSKEKIGELINKALPNPLYEDNDKSDDGMLLTANRVDSIEVNFEGKSIEYTIPMDIWVLKDLGLTDVEAKGKIKLTMSTAYNVLPDWSIEAETELVAYKWLEKPKIKLGFVEFPVEKIAGMVINKSKKTITERIDAELAKTKELRNQVEKAWEKIKEPILLSEKDSLWVLLSPKTIGLSTPISTQDSIESNIYVECKPIVSVGLKTEIDSLFPLPEMQWNEDGKNKFTVNLLTEISYEEAERLAREYAVGKTFTEGSRSITIEELKLYGQDENLVVDAKVNGSYNGSIYLIGKPVLNPDENILSLEDFDYELKTKNFLINSFGWLVKKGFKKSLKEKMKFPLQENLEKIRKTVQEQLKERELTKGIKVKGVLNKLKVNKTLITPNAIAASITLEGTLNIIIDELNL